MARITIHLTDPLVSAVKTKAEASRRSVSNYLQMLVEADLGGAGPIVTAAAELNALGADPVMALRDKIAEVTRDQFLSTETKTETHPHDEKTVSTPPPLSGADRRHPPANVRVVALRTPARPPLCVGPNPPRRP